ncbi:MAG: hypothetical protein LC650_05620, partial [Actinobacteria bacterium]|nr:hypothetical protein [Actinomycetota bacterium]
HYTSHFGDKSSSFYSEPNGRIAVSFALAGWKKGLSYINEDMEVLLSIPGAGRPEYKRDYHGAFIDIGTYVSGRPDCWIAETESQDVHTSGRIKRIAVGASFMGGVSPTQYRRRGASIMAIIDLLEEQGFRVQLDLIATSNAGRGSHSTKIRAKQAEDSLNREKLAYALMQSDYFRRFVFGLRGLRHSDIFHKDGGGATINLKHAEKPDGTPYSEDYDLLFPNADDDYWNDYNTVKGARGTIIKELKSLGVDVELN